MPQLVAGAAKAIITPYVGAWMAGFAGRDHGCEGVHDDLHARAIVLRAGDTTVGLVGCDLIGLSPDSVARVRERVEAECGIAADHVMVSCTHTHSGPTVGPLRHPGLDVELVHVIERQIAGAVIAASRSMADASMGVVKGTTSIGINRRERQADGSMRLGKNPTGLIDPEIGVLRVNDADGKADHVTRLDFAGEPKDNGRFIVQRTIIHIVGFQGHAGVHALDRAARVELPGQQRTAVLAAKTIDHGEFGREPANGGAAIRCLCTRRLVMYLSGYKGASSDPLSRAWLDLKKETNYTKL